MRVPKNIILIFTFSKSLHTAGSHGIGIFAGISNLTCFLFCSGVWVTWYIECTPPQLRDSTRANYKVGTIQVGRSLGLGTALRWSGNCASCSMRQFGGRERVERCDASPIQKTLHRSTLCCFSILFTKRSNRTWFCSSKIIIMANDHTRSFI